MDGEFAGRFQTIRPAEEFDSGESFDLSLETCNVTAEPSLKDIRGKLPTVTFNLVVESVWYHTLKEPAGPEVTHVEITCPDGAP